MTAHLLTDITLVLGPPLHEAPPFHDFQAQAASGSGISTHPWVAHEHDAVNGLTVRDGTVATHTLLETIVGGVLGVNVVIADVDRQWVRHEDGQLYAAISFSADDVRPRAAGLALQQDDAIAALNSVGASLSTLDGRAWLAWSSRTVPDAPQEEQTQRTTRLMAKVADMLFASDSSRASRDAGVDESSELDLSADLVRAIVRGCEHAEDLSHGHVKELRWLRHRDPLRVEWQHVLMDAFFLGALPETQIAASVVSGTPRDLSYLFIGRDRTDRLKADPYITPRFHRELAVRSYLTAYALQRLAPQVARGLVSAMGEGRA